MDEQTAIGKAIRALVEKEGMAPADAADRVLGPEGAPLIELARASNGRVIQTVFLGPRNVEPTHALDAPPLLVEDDLPDELLQAAQTAAMDGGDPFGPPCECGRPTATLPRGGRVCLNLECPRYEEVIR